MKSTDYPIIHFKKSSEWRKWLQENHATADGIWIRCYKKASGIVSISHGEALDEALCFGWIDGQAKGYDEKSWLQKYTPRRAKSLWSKINREHVARLIKEKKMMPAGLQQIEEAKKDGRWEQAYDSPSNMVVPQDFLNELKKDIKAFTFFESLNKANQYAIVWRLQTAKKPETRVKRLTTIFEMLKKGEKFH